MKELFATLFNATADLALYLDPDGTILAANDTVAQRLGVPVRELEGRCVYDLFPKDIAETRRNVAREVLKTKAPVQYREATKHGGEYETRVQPVLGPEELVTGFIVVARDISDRTRSEEERLRLATAIEQAVEAFIILDTNFVIQYVNQAFESMTGYSQAETKGRALADLYQGPAQEASFQTVIETLMGGDIWAGRTFNTRKDGTVFQSEKTVSPIRGKHGIPLGYVSVWRDVTHLAELERQLRQAQKMEAIGTLAGGIAHDFNNILGPIILHAELSLSSDNVDEGLRHSFQEILQAANRARDLVDQILNLSRKREIDDPVPFRLSSIVKECLKLLRPTLPATITLDLIVDTDEDLVVADPTQIHQVVMNLCTNASHAIDGPGIISLRVSERELGWENGREYMGGAVPGRYVMFSIRDTGHGMPAAYLNKIFDPFFTTKKEGVGTGLGLTIVQSIISRLNGAIKVSSAPGEGASFDVLLPASDAPAEVRVSESDAAVPLGHGERILLVDDEPAVAHGCRMVLEKLGYLVTVCHSGPRALDLFLREPERFQAVLADVTMPEMTGFDLARVLLKHHPGLPIVLCSGHSEGLGLARVKELGVRDSLKKPYGIKDLARTLRRVLDERDKKGKSTLVL